MEFPFPVKRLFKNKISKVSNSLVPEGFVDAGPLGRQCPSYVAQVVDAMGVASAEAQNLVRPVTSADRLRNSDHVLFVMTDPGGGSKDGRVASFLKMGYKNLYLLDHQGHNHEMKPWCVLDFYTHEKVQRRGFGKELFDHMLKDFNIAPQYLAMDRPSDSFMYFVKKHYGLFKTIPQVNNYAIYDDFFSKRADGKAQYPSRVHGRTTLLGRNANRRKSGAALDQTQQMTQQQATAACQVAAAGGSAAARRNIRSTVSECLNYPQQPPTHPQGCPVGVAAAGPPRYPPSDGRLGTPGAPLVAGPPGTPYGSVMAGLPGTPCGPVMAGPPGTHCGPTIVGPPGTPCGSSSVGPSSTPYGAPVTPCCPPSAGGSGPVGDRPQAGPPGTPGATPQAGACPPAVPSPLVGGGDGSCVSAAAPSPPAAGRGPPAPPPSQPLDKVPSAYQIMRRSKYVHTPLW